ncbi:hypothetical protein BKA69DRAFT_455808 [Paraphysoderma sedebokerense]|nr:hypothetical protein BKA69DRAFT_455808 [Paraphysoderma sedebokerense]
MTLLTKLKFVDIYNATAKIPFLGPYIFGLFIKIAAPYSGSVSPYVISLKPGECKMSITERFGLRNPFNSIHAIALLNVGELATGLGFLAHLQEYHPNRRAIVTSISGKYYKKARGTVTASFEIEEEVKKWLQKGEKGDIIVRTAIKNEEGVKVAECEVVWIVNAEDSSDKDKKKN